MATHNELVTISTQATKLTVMVIDMASIKEAV